MKHLEEIGQFLQTFRNDTPQSLQYFANPTLERIYETQKLLEQKCNVFNNEEVQSNQYIEEESSSITEHQLLNNEKRVPTVPNSQKIQKTANKTDRRKIAKPSLEVLRCWLMENIDDPYPSNEAKKQLAKASNLTFKQVIVCIK